MPPPTKRARPIKGKPTTYRGTHDMGGWWQWSMEVEEHSLPSYRPFIQRGDLVFDIGSNCGRKTYIFLKLGARVIAVDPLYTWGPEFVPEFYWKWGKHKDVTPVARAVTKEREVELTINRFMPYVSSIDRAWMTESAHAPKNKQPYYVDTSTVKRKVQGITLDGLIGIYGIPAFIKVDVEGFENEAIVTLTHPVKGLNMEFHRDWIPEKAMAHMDSLGQYEWSYCLDNRGEFVAPWMGRAELLDWLPKHLTDQGKGSWGDIYGRLVD